MKINNFKPSGVNPYKNQLNKMDQMEKGKHKKKDVVEISPEAKEMQSISSIEKERQIKVDELKVKLRTELIILNHQIAKSMIDFYKK